MLYNCHAEILDLEDFEKMVDPPGRAVLKWWTRRVGRFKMVEAPV
jgi:hypothetical protein